MLVVNFGPDTSELMLRVGIHSGQVTMGVLRNERARYQLFGDCVNTSKFALKGDRVKQSGFLSPKTNLFFHLSLCYYFQLREWNQPVNVRIAISLAVEVCLTT